MSDESADRCGQHAIQAFIAIGQIKQDIGEIKAMIVDVKGHVITQNHRITSIEEWKNQLIGAAKWTAKVAGALVLVSGLGLGIARLIIGG